MRKGDFRQNNKKKEQKKVYSIIKQSAKTAEKSA